MPDLIWLNGEVMPIGEARVSVEDRGFQFADGVYEVIRIYNGTAFTLAEHLHRLERSCASINLPLPLSKKELASEIQKLIAKAAVKEGMIYMQITRGVSPRNHVIASKMKPTVLFHTRVLPPVPRAGQVEGVKVISVPDERWKRCWIKSIALLPNILAKNAAVAAGAYEAVFIEDGWVTECSASNIHMVSRGAMITHPVGPKVLPGITRAMLLDLAPQAGVPAIERPFTEAEAIAADEVFITSTTRELVWVSHWNGRQIAEKCGAATLKLHEAFGAKVREETA